MSRKQRPPTRIATILVSLAVLWIVGLWFWLEPSSSVAQRESTVMANLEGGNRRESTATRAVSIGQVTTVTQVTPTLPPTQSMAGATALPELIIVTPTPQPLDVLAAATQSVQLTAEAMRNGTPTPLPLHVMVATVTPTPNVVTATPTAENQATATYHAILATAIAMTTGMPEFVIATATRPAASTAVASPPSTTPTKSAPTNSITVKIPDGVQAAEVPPLPTRTVASPTATQLPTQTPTALPTFTATSRPTNTPRPTSTDTPTALPSFTATSRPTNTPRPTSTDTPTALPTETPTAVPTATPTEIPTEIPTETPTEIPTEIPTPLPSPVPVLVAEIRFITGATSAVVENDVTYAVPVQYFLNAREGQVMRVELRDADGGDLRVDVSTADGFVIGSSGVGERLEGALPSPGDYFLTVWAPDDSVVHDFALWVEILP